MVNLVMPIQPVPSVGGGVVFRSVKWMNGPLKLKACRITRSITVGFAFWGCRVFNCFTALPESKHRSSAWANAAKAAGRQSTWQAAIAEITDKLQTLRANGQAQTVGCITDSDRGTVASLLSRFMTVFGSPNYMRTPSIEDSYEMALYLMQGVQATAGFDVEQSDFILSFGSGVIEGWGSPVRMFQANSKRVAGQAKLVQIEPRLSTTAAKADQWIAINPGTEADLALGLANIIIRENRQKANFIDMYTEGFDDWKQAVLGRYSPDEVVRITGVDKETLVSLARSFVRASRPLAICGRGEGRRPGSLREVMAVHRFKCTGWEHKQTRRCLGRSGSRLYRLARGRDGSRRFRGACSMLGSMAPVAIDSLTRAIYSIVWLKGSMRVSPIPCRPCS